MDLERMKKKDIKKTHTQTKSETEERIKDLKRKKKKNHTKHTNQERDKDLFKIDFFF